MPKRNTERRLALGACLALAVAGTAASAQERKLNELSAGKGQTVFMRYCAACHGRQGDGKGPLAGELRSPVTDLTELAAKNDGKFPYEKVTRMVDGRERVGAHGTSDMPAWGDAFSKTEGRDAPTVEEAIDNLANFVWSLQRAKK